MAQDSMTLCRVDDDYVRDIVRWVVTLDNGEVIYQDDDRPGVTPRKAWVRLKNYCKVNSHHIVKMRVQFRNNYIDLPDGQEGYFFVQKAFGVWGDTNTYHAYVVGYLKDGLVYLTHYKMPEIIEIQQETRNVDLESPTLIAKNVVE